MFQGGSPGTGTCKESGDPGAERRNRSARKQRASIGFQVEEKHRGKDGGDRHLN